jgi:hypothetical protein
MRGSIVYCLLILLFTALWYQSSPLEMPENSPLIVDDVTTPATPVHDDAGKAPSHPQHARFAAMLKSGSNPPAR